jgi:hypothetical protein
VNYYTNWWTNRNGTGSHPPILNPFSQNGDTFTVQNGHNMTANDDWVVDGTGSKVVIESGGKITTGDYEHEIVLDLNDGGTYEVDNTTYGLLEQGTWHANSNFILNNSGIQFEDSFTYGNLTVSAGTADVRGSSTFTVQGTLTINGGTFDGGLSADHTNNYGNIIINSGNFYGCTGSATIIHNISGNITVNGGYFRSTDGTGTAVFNVGGDVAISAGGWFWAAANFGTGDVPATAWNVSGSFTNAGYYYARNKTSGYYPTFTFSGTGKSIKLGSFSSLEQGQHSITFAVGSSYTLTGDIFVSENYSLNIRGTLDAATYSINRNSYTTGDPAIYNYGTLRTAKTAGLAGLGTNYTCNLYNISRLYLQSGCTVEYYASSSQTVTPLTTYKALVLSGGGTKNLSEDATVADNITMNATLSLGSGALLTLNGTMSGSSPIDGSGDLVINGTAAALNLVTCEVDQFDLNRSNGCYLNGNLVANSVNLYSGTLYLGSYGLTLYGALYRASGILTGSTTASLDIRGSSAQLSLPAITLGTLTLNRSNGCIITGNLNIYNTLTLTLGTLNVSTYTLGIFGTMSRVNGYLDVDSGILMVGTSTSDITLSGFSVVNVLSLNRSGRSCYMGQDLEVTTLSIASGTLAIGAHTLTLTGTFSCSGSLTGGSSSQLRLDSMTSGPTLPAVQLYSFYMDISYTCTLGGNMTVESMNLERGTLYISGSNVLTVNNALYGASTNGLTGSALSTLVLNGSSVTPLSLPKLNVGNFNFNRSGTAYIASGSAIQSSLTLMQGTLNIPVGSDFTLNPNCTVYRSNGQITGTPVFADRIMVIYTADLTTGPEIPAASGVLDVLHILPNLEVTAAKDIRVITKVEVMDNSVLDLGSHTLYLDNDCDIESGNGALIWGRAQQDIGAMGFQAPALGIWVLPGPEVTDFAVTHKEESQILPMGVSIERTWKLEGSFDGDNTVTFIWDPAANNGIVFSPTNLAVALWKNGEVWTRLPGGVDVSGQPICMATYIVSHFSDWTITAEDQTLPVVLSSFSAAQTQSGFVQLNWTTQSETSLAGFRILRSSSNSPAQALDLGVLVPAANTSTAQAYAYLDEDIEQTGTYYYWLQILELSGESSLSGAVSVTVTEQPGTPDTPPAGETALLSLYPNPFNPRLNLLINHKADGYLKVTVYDLIGRKVALLYDDYSVKGIKNLGWNGTSDNGTSCGTGIYFVRCDSNRETKTLKAILLK